MRKSSLLLALVAIGSMPASQAFSQAAPAQPPSPPATQSQPSAQAAPPAAPNPGSGVVLTTEKDKISYAIGMNIGNRLRHEPLDLDSKMFEQGLQDAMAGRPTALTPEDARKVLFAAEQDLRAKQEAKLKAEAAENKEKGEAFLAANKSKPGVVALPSGLQYQVLREGTGPKPTATDRVQCNYRGTLIDGTEFDSSYKRGQPVTVPVGRLIKGWTEALELMPVGSKWRLFIPADLAYGDRPAGSVIGPDSTLIFEVELLSIESPQPAAPEAEPEATRPAATTQPPTSTPQTSTEGAK